jgi:predicted ATPase
MEVEGVETRMVGRETELKYLQDALLTTIEDHKGQVITISGEAGVGKSRLLYEFQNWLELMPEEIILFLGRSRQEAQGLPYSLLRDLFSFRFQIQEDDTGEAARQKIESGIRGVFGSDENGMMRAHIIGQMFGFDFSNSPHLKGVINDPEQLRNRGLMYLQDYFQSLSGENPILIILEDIHWADDSSLDAVDWLGERTSNERLLFLCATRSRLFERRPNWRKEKPYRSKLNLDPLTKSDSFLLMSEILKLSEDIPDELSELVARRAEGNPLYVEEMIKMLIEDGVIIPGEDAWQIESEQISHVEVPSTLVGVLQARLESLPPRERIVLQQASIVGRLFWDRLVAYLNIESDDRRNPQFVPIALNSLIGRELVFHNKESTLAGSLEYIFKHDVLREVTYESVAKGLRRTYHGLVADWLIANCGDRISEYSGFIADHLLIGGREERACQYFTQAGEYALSSYANKEAEEHFRRALSLECEEIDKANSLEGLGEAIERQARHKEAIQIWSEAINLNLELGNLTSVARIHTKSSRAAWMKGDHPRCLEICQEGLKWIKGEPESHEVAMLLHETGRVYYFNGKPDEALEYCQKALQMAERLEDIEVQADTFTTLGTLSNKPPEAMLEALTRAVDLAHQGNIPRVESRALHNLGLIREDVTGDIIKSREDYERVF